MSRTGPAHLLSGWVARYATRMTAARRQLSSLAKLLCETETERAPPAVAIGALIGQSASIQVRCFPGSWRPFLHRKRHLVDLFFDWWLLEVHPSLHSADAALSYCVGNEIRMRSVSVVSAVVVLVWRLSPQLVLASLQCGGPLRGLRLSGVCVWWRRWQDVVIVRLVVGRGRWGAAGCDEGWGGSLTRMKRVLDQGGF